MNELKKADEVVRALRDYASDCDSDSEYCFQCTFACVCDKFDNNAPKIIADLIESLTAQLTSVTAERDAAINDIPQDCYHCKHKPEKETPKDECGCRKCGCGCDVNTLEIRNAQLCHWEWCGIIEKEQKHG